MHGTVRAVLNRAVLSDAVPVADGRQIPRLVKVVVGAVPTGQSILVIVACGKAVPAHQAAD